MKKPSMDENNNKEDEKSLYIQNTNERRNC